MSFLSRGIAPLPYSDFYSEVERRMRAGDSDSFILLVPNRIAQRRIERQLVEATSGRSISQANILTLADFTGSLSTSAFPKLRLLSDAESGIFVEQAIRRLIESNALSYFERPHEEVEPVEMTSFPIPRGTFELVVNTIRQLKEAGVIPSQLLHDLKEARKKKGETTEVRRAADIHAIYQTYEEKLGDTFVDTYGQIIKLNGRYAESNFRPVSEAISQATNDFRTGWPKVSDIFLQGFTRLELPTIALLAAIASIQGVRVVVELECDGDNLALFSGVSELEQRLAKIGFQNVLVAGSAPGAKSSKSSRLRKHLSVSLFNPTLITERYDAPEIVLQPAVSPYDEVEQIARQIKTICEADADVKRDLSQIVIATPLVQNYTPLFQEIFKRHDIPAFIADRYHLDRSQLMLSLLALFDISRFGLRRREVLRALSSPYFRFRLSTDELLDAKNLLEVIARYRLTGNMKGWKLSLAAKFDRLAEALAEAEDERSFQRIELERKRIARATSDLDQLMTVLAPLDHPLKPAQFCEVVRSLLTRLEVGKQLLAHNESTIHANTLELDTRGYRAFVKLIEDLESLFTLMGIEDQRLSLTFYVDRLKAAAIWTRYNPRPRSGSVLITSLEQSVGHPADYVFLAGLTDGTLPALYQPQVFLMDSMQQGEKKHLVEDRLLFYRAVTNFNKNLFLSWPTRTQSDGENAPSIFIDALREVATIDERKIAEPTDAIYSYRDLYLKSGDLLRARKDSALTELLTNGHSVPATSFYTETLKNHVPGAVEAIRDRSQSSDTIHRGWIDRSLLTKQEEAKLDSMQSRIWSITQLEMYANCAFKFFADQVLALDAVPNVEEGLTALDRGTILHEVLREFMTSRRNRNLPDLQGLPEDQIDEAFEDILSIAERQINAVNSDHPFWRLDAERLLGDKKSKDGYLWKFIEKEQSLVESEPRAKFFEVSFGSKTGKKSESDSKLSQPEPIDLGGIKLRGKIDRIDIADDHFTIVDYKLGKSTSKLKDVNRGTSLQLPLYLKVAEDLLRRQLYELTGVAALYHKVLDSSKRELGVAVRSFLKRAYADVKSKSGFVESEEELRNIIEETVAKAKRYVEGMALGQFQLIEKDLTRQCGYCDYRSACRVKEAQDMDLLRDYVPYSAPMGPPGEQAELEFST